MVLKKGFGENMNWKDKFNKIQKGVRVICVEESMRRHKDRSFKPRGYGWKKGKTFIVKDVDLIGNVVWPEKGSGIFLNYVKKVSR